MGIWAESERDIIIEITVEREDVREGHTVGDREGALLQLGWEERIRVNRESGGEQIIYRTDDKLE